MTKRFSCTNELVGDVIRVRLAADAISNRKVNGKALKLHR